MIYSNIKETLEVTGVPVRGCELIGNSVNFWRDSISHCCGFFEDSTVTEICKFDGGSFPIDHYILSYQQFTLQNILGQGNCSRCRLIQKVYPPTEFTFFQSISLNHFWRCNLKCNYCLENVRTGVGKPYNIVPIFQELYDQGYMREETIVSWGGGEPSLYEFLDEALCFCGERNIPQEIHTSSVLFSKPIANSLKHIRSFLRISPDSGTPETYEKIKGFDYFSRVWENISRYREHGKVIVKYLLTADNLRDEDIFGFVEKCRESSIDQIEIVPEFCSYLAMSESINNEIAKNLYINAARKLYSAAKSKGIDAYPCFWDAEDTLKISMLP